MNLQTAYDFLNRPHRIDLKVRGLMYKREALLSCLLPKALTPKAIQVQESIPSDKLSDIMAEVQLIEQEINRLLNEKARAIREIVETVDKLDREEERLVLIGFFVSRRTMTDLAEEMHYSVQGVYTLRRRGMTKIKALLENE